MSERESNSIFLLIAAGSCAGTYFGFNCGMEKLRRKRDWVSVFTFVKSHNILHDNKAIFASIESQNG